MSFVPTSALALSFDRQLTSALVLLLSLSPSSATLSTTRHVTAIFSILMRLRQAVLHPQLVLNRLNTNLKANSLLKGRTAAQKEGDLDEKAIRDLIVQYGGAADGRGSYAKGVLEGMLGEGDGEEEMCMVCLDVSWSYLIIEECSADLV